jgi:GMP synthase (glutamine-hydrolysing)
VGRWVADLPRHTILTGIDLDAMPPPLFPPPWCFPMAIIIFQHSEIGSAGRLAATLRDHGFRLRFCRIDREGAAAIPPDLDDVQGVVSLGGPQNIDESHDWLAPEMNYLREAHGRQLPVIGICLGAQLIATALGGKVGPMADESGARRSEWGFREIAINPIGQVETLMAGVQWNARHFCAHAYEVKELPTESTLLASSRLCKVQIFRAGLRTYGFQHHLECDRPMIDAQIAQGASLDVSGRSRAELTAEADEHYATFARLSDRLCVNLATYLFPLEHRLAG